MSKREKGPFETGQNQFQECIRLHSLSPSCTELIFDKLGRLIQGCHNLQRILQHLVSLLADGLIAGAI